MKSDVCPSSSTCSLAAEARSWEQSLAGLPHDIYHTFAYHQCSGLGSEGQAYLFSFAEGECRFVWPYILRDVSEVPGCGSLEARDVTSVYGYPGPVIAGEIVDPAFIERAWRSLIEVWRSQGVIAAFTRMHPDLSASNKFGFSNQLVQQGYSTSPELAAGIVECGAVVSLDLTIPLPEQVRRYRKTLRQDIRKIRENGFTSFHDTQWEWADAFIELYNTTMHRLSSSSSYLIDRTWLAKCRSALGDHLQLLVTQREGQIASVLLALEYDKRVHAHLTGTNPRFVHQSPLKVLLDDTRLWAAARGNDRFYLGGGLGGRCDSLFQFKAAFSQDYSQFCVGRWIIDADVYGRAVAMRRDFIVAEGGDWEPGPFFPAYRAMQMPRGQPPNPQSIAQMEVRT